MSILDVSGSKANAFNKPLKSLFIGEGIYFLLFLVIVGSMQFQLLSQVSAIFYFTSEEVNVQRG